MARHLGVDLCKAPNEIVDTWWAHDKILFLKENFIDHLTAIVNHDGDDTHISYHKQCKLKIFFFGWHNRIYGQKWDLCQCCVH